MIAVGIGIGGGVGYGAGKGLDYITGGGWGKFWWRLLGGREVNELPPDPIGTQPRNGKGGMERGRGDDKFWGFDERELRSAIDEATKAGNTKLAGKLRYILKIKYTRKDKGK